MARDLGLLETVGGRGVMAKGKGWGGSWIIVAVAVVVAVVWIYNEVAG
jgi:hypothetical protein